MWKSIFDSKPTNNQIVWIRVISIYGQLTLAQYKASTQQFTTVTTSINIPAYQVGRWRAQ
jgi:hypothetical protein